MQQPVAIPADQLDRKALQSYLRAQLPQLGELQDAHKFSDGQSNPTFLLGAFAVRLAHHLSR